MRFFKDEEMQNYLDTVVNVESMKAYYRGRHDPTREQLAEDELIRRKLHFDAWKATGADVTENLPDGEPSSSIYHQSTPHGGIQTPAERINAGVASTG